MRVPASALVVVVAILACSSETSPPPGERTFRDEAGRTCTVDVGDALAIATCDVSPPDTRCLDSAPCFAVRVASGALVNCGGCGAFGGGPGCYTPSPATGCSSVVCVDDLGCPSLTAVCREGACRAP